MHAHANQNTSITLRFLKASDIQKAKHESKQITKVNSFLKSASEDEPWRVSKRDTHYMRTSQKKNKTRIASEKKHELLRTFHKAFGSTNSLWNLLPINRQIKKKTLTFFATERWTASGNQIGSRCLVSASGGWVLNHLRKYVTLRLCILGRVLMLCIHFYFIEFVQYMLSHLTRAELFKYLYFKNIFF